MKAILTIKDGNKDGQPYTERIEVTPQMCDKLENIARKIYQETGQYYMSVNVFEI